MRMTEVWYTEDGSGYVVLVHKHKGKHEEFVISASYEELAMLEQNDEESDNESQRFS